MLTYEWPWRSPILHLSSEPADILDLSDHSAFISLRWLRTPSCAPNDKLSCRAEANGAGLLTVETSLDPKPIRGQLQRQVRQAPNSK